MSEVTDPRPETSLAPSPQTELAAKSGALVSRGLEILSTSTLASALEPLALAIEARGHGDPSHILRIKAYAVALARDLGVSEREIHALEIAALLRNIGMLAFGDSLLDSLRVPELLTQEELHMIFVHPEVGAEIIGSTQSLAAAAPLVRHHHERWDGEGYPTRLKGTDIPLGARVLAIVEYYDALASGCPGDVITADRRYEELSHEAAVEKLREQAGLAFDPDLVERFATVVATLQSPGSTTTQLHVVEKAFDKANQVAPRGTVSQVAEQDRDQARLDFAVTFVISLRLIKLGLFRLRDVRHAISRLQATITDAPKPGEAEQIHQVLSECMRESDVAYELIEEASELLKPFRPDTHSENVKHMALERAVNALVGWQPWGPYLSLELSQYFCITCGSHGLITWWQIIGYAASATDEERRALVGSLFKAQDELRNETFASLRRIVDIIANPSLTDVLRLTDSEHEQFMRHVKAHFPEIAGRGKGVGHLSELAQSGGRTADVLCDVVSVVIGTVDESASRTP